MRRVGVIGASAALVTSLFACRAGEHREAIDDTRAVLVGRGCAMGGLDPARPEFGACVDAGRARCKSTSGRAVEDCARNIALGAP